MPTICISVNTLVNKIVFNLKEFYDLLSRDDQKSILKNKNKQATEVAII